MTRLSAASSCLLAVLFLAAGCAEDPSSPLVFYNATVLTMDPSQPHATAFVVEAGRFVAVGEEAAMLAVADSTSRRIDLEGATVVPGFNDAHLHPLFMPAGGIDLGDARRASEIVEVLRASAAVGRLSEWIFGYAYDDTLLGRHLTKEDLDLVSTTQPVMAWHGSLHLFVVNSFVLDNANIHAGSPDPPGGQYFKDDEGRLTGLLGERSALESLLEGEIESPLPHGLESALGQLDRFVDVAHSEGITSIGDGLVTPELAFVYWWSGMREKGLRVSLMWDAEEIELVERVGVGLDLLARIGIRPLSNEWLRAGTVKVFHGMSLSGRTARLYEPYHDRPDYYGLEPQRSQGELNELIANIHDLGLQAAIHSNGDFEIDMVLEAIDRAVASARRDHRHRIEHGSIVNAEILERMKGLEVVMAPHSYIYEKGPMTEAYGSERWPMMFANASTFEYGIPNAANSDYPVSGLSPLLRIQSLVTRTSRFGKTYGAEQRLTVDQALHAYTMGGAFATFEEDVKGSITSGKFADFVVLSADPHDVDPFEIKDIEVMATYVDGVLRFDRSDSFVHP